MAKILVSLLGTGRKAKGDNTQNKYETTDYVFDGKSNTPYREDEKTNPINFYGYTKLLGEEAIKEVNPKALIVRTSWVYGKYGNNFVKKILKLAQERELKFEVDENQSQEIVEIEKSVQGLLNEIAEVLNEAKEISNHNIKSAELLKNLSNKTFKHILAILLNII